MLASAAANEKLPACKFQSQEGVHARLHVFTLLHCCMQHVAAMHTFADQQDVVLRAVRDVRGCSISAADCMFWVFACRYWLR